MSGITGIFLRDGSSVDADLLAHMTNRIAHRGFDGAGTWHAGSIGLGHRMLWTTAESLHETLPFVDGPLAITADARVDNRAKLIATCSPDTSGTELTDSALILSAYKRWGAECPNHLLGDFAFAIWDGRDNALFCARDHMGVKPFYYYDSGQFVAFASEIKALLCLPQVPLKLNELQLAVGMAEIRADRESTSFQGIARLPAAHAIKITEKGAKLDRYWSLDATREVHFDSDREYEKAFRDVFCEAVRCRLRSAFPVGSELSGGLDSSSVVCTARQILCSQQHVSPDESRLHVFSLVSEARESDEREYMNAVIDQGDVEPHFVHLGQLAYPVDVERMVWHEEEPRYFHPRNYSSWVLLNLVQQTGVRVLMDGLDGDTVISYGEDYLIQLARQFKWGTLLRELRGYNEPFSASLRQSLLDEVIMPLARQAAPKVVRKAWNRLHKRARGDIVKAAFINQDFAQHIGLITYLEKRQNRPLRGTTRDRHFEDLTSPSVQFFLELTDKMAAAFSIELRHPFFDRRVVEFCLALPPDQKLRNGYNRAIVRRALALCLPPAVRTRKSKAAGDPHIDSYVRHFETERIEDVLFRNYQSIESYFDLQALRAAYQSAIQGSFRGELDPGLNHAWKAAALATWLLQQENRPLLRDR